MVLFILLLAQLALLLVMFWLHARFVRRWQKTTDMQGKLVTNIVNTLDARETRDTLLRQSQSKTQAFILAELEAAKQRIKHLEDEKETL